MKLILFTSIIFCSLSSLIAQSTNKALFIDSKSQIKLHQGDRIKIKTKNGERFHGKLQINSDSTILIKEKTILLRDIVKLNTKSETIKKSGQLITIAGTSLILSGTGFYIWANNTKPNRYYSVFFTKLTRYVIGTVFIVIGVPLQITGITVWSLSNSYNTSNGNTKFSIIELE